MVGVRCLSARVHLCAAPKNREMPPAFAEVTSRHATSLGMTISARPCLGYAPPSAPLTGFAFPRDKRCDARSAPGVLCLCGAAKITMFIREREQRPRGDRQTA